jgi:hypothetical protein
VQGRGDQCLDLDKQRAAALECGRDGDSGSAECVLLHESAGWVRYLGKTVGGHFEDTDLLG